MASSASPGKYEYLVTVPDHHNSLSKRLTVRPTHLKNLTPLIQSGKVVFGGATVSSHHQEAEGVGGPDMTGSVMLVKADSEEEVLELVRNDVYSKEGVWDVGRIKVEAFRCAVRTAM